MCACVYVFRKMRDVYMCVFSVLCCVLCAYVSQVDRINFNYNESMDLQSGNPGDYGRRIPPPSDTNRCVLIGEPAMWLFMLSSLEAQTINYNQLCLDWVRDQQRSIAATVMLTRRARPCPCYANQAIRDPGWMLWTLASTKSCFVQIMPTFTWAQVYCIVWFLHVYVIALKE